MMQRNLLFVLTCCFIQLTFAQQKLTVDNKRILQQQEDKLKLYGLKMIQDREASDRFMADSVFIKGLVKAFQVPYSFYYPFDSLVTISKLTPPDSSFRIFTWQFEKDENYFRQRGAIQFNTKDGKLRLIPLFDASEFTDKPLDSVRSAKNWIGAIYYRIIPVEHAGKPFYTLLGYDNNNIRSTKKWIEVLHFENEQPIFGGPLFSFNEDSIPKPAQLRFELEYKSDARARIQYEEEMEMIIYDHLISESDEPDKKWTLIPDGDYEGFEWRNGSWQHINKVFTQKLADGEVPLPSPLKEDPLPSTNTKPMPKKKTEAPKKKQ